MYNKNIFLILHIIYCFQVIYARNKNNTILYTYNNITTHYNIEQFVYTYKNNSISKNEVLNIKNKSYIGYFCKNDLCISMDYRYEKPFIEFPDENGNVNLYIMQTLSYKAIESDNNFRNKTCIHNDCVSHNCNDDSQCLYNKCFNNYCIFNDKAPIVHCDSIYLGYGKSYMYCGKAYEDVCNNDDECSSKICSNGFCNLQMYGPSDNEMPPDSFFVIYYSIVFISLTSILCCCCRSYRRHKNQLKNSELKKIDA